MSDFFKGMRYFFAGVGLIAKPGIKRYVIIPLVINILLFVVLFSLMVGVIDGWTSETVSNWSAWWSWVKYVIYLLFIMIYLFFFIFLFSAVGTCIAAPFNGVLSAEVELYLTGQPLAERSVWQNIGDVPRVILRQLGIIFYFLMVAAVIWLVSLLPVINVAAFMLWFLFSAWFLTLQYLDFPTDNHRIPLTQVRKWLGGRRGMALGFGVSLVVCLAIPVLNFFVMPVAVAGATKFFVAEFDLSANIQ